MFDVDWMGLLVREVLRERTPALIAESCAWAVGLSDRPHLRRRNGLPQPTGPTLGERAAGGLPLSSDDGGRLDLGDAVPGSFQDALNALADDGSVHAERFDDEVLVPFVHDTCVTAAERARTDRPAAWAELADDVGEDGGDLAAVVRAGEWEAPLRIDAEQLVLAALGTQPLLEVETEGLPLSLVRAAEAATRAAVPAPPARGLPDDSLAGALFLARAALEESGCTVPVPPTEADLLLAALADAGLEAEEVPVVLPHLPVEDGTIERITANLSAD
ncbi:hypothetical protein SAMN05660662_0506 [Blastococcus aurantiacus]|uniref:Uncharacterized protein n=1 Tax=Blastococcus aurantiacus TaxID=1550231 RepID=A0A1G7HCX3_9ACTN|nr:hypothetical protein [Blastococcus aurantiacus]SDE97909.1 hypothetical protein SAMN05660662_0506 [Blastococcus aurantiacus]